jgi:predicted phosphoribosyltransferase
MGDRKPTPLENKILIVVDDGIATGHTLMSTLKMLRKEKPGRIVVAVPVCPVDAAKRISEVADEFVTLLLPESFHGVGGFYEDFSQVSDEEVKKYLRQSREREQNT